MKTYELNNGHHIPLIGLGTWQSEPNEVCQAVKDALNIGYRHIDCAWVYGNEDEVGQAIQDAISQGIVTRDELFITSKLWSNAHHPDQVIPAIQETLKALRLDYLDLYLIHWPVAFKNGLEFPESRQDIIPSTQLSINETWEAMETLIEKGMTKSIGVSNFGLQKLKSLLANCQIKPVINQVELHPFFQQNELLAYTKENNIFLTAYSPLGTSDVFEELKGVKEPTTLLNHPVIEKIAEKHNITPAQVILAWGINRGTIVIPKSTKAKRIEQNFLAKDIMLDKEDMQVIAELDQNYRTSDGEWFMFEGGEHTLENFWR